MDKEITDIERDVNMAIVKEPKNGIQPDTSNNHKKAAMLWYFLTKNHCFVDGNKRVGFYAAAILLKINGYSDQVEDDEAYDKTNQITCSQLTGDDLDVYLNELSGWLEERFID